MNCRHTGAIVIGFCISMDGEIPPTLRVRKGERGSSLLEIGEEGRGRCKAAISGTPLTELAVVTDSLSMFRCLIRS